MKILHFGTLDVNAGGPAMSTYLTLKGVRDLGIDAEIMQYSLSAAGRLRGCDVPVHYAKPPVDHKFAYSPRLKKEIRDLGEYDIYHAQGIWQYPTYAIVDVANEKGKPYIITPRGMLYPQDITKSNRAFKKFSLKVRLLDDLNRAACVHVTCNEEMRHCRELGVTSPIAVIPNPVEIKDYPYRKADRVFRLGYIGRLSPRKNVESLIHAFAGTGSLAENAELLIIGGGDKRYEEFLKAEVGRLKLANVSFTGFLSGEEKDKSLASCSVLAMPSEFENFGNVILEGLVRRIPCIATKGSPWEELATNKCGWWVDYSDAAIADAVRQAASLPEDVLHDMGNNGRMLMERRYSVAAIGTAMKALYGWICGMLEKPGFVYC